MHLYHREALEITRIWVGFMGNVLQNYESVEKNHILRMPSTKQFARFIE